MRHIAVILSLLMLLLLCGCREEGVADTKAAGKTEAVSEQTESITETVLTVISDTTETETEAEETEASVQTETETAQIAVTTEAVQPQETTESVKTESTETFAPVETASPVTQKETSRVTEETTGPADVTEPICEETTGPAEETTAPVAPQTTEPQTSVPSVTTEETVFETTVKPVPKETEPAVTEQEVTEQSTAGSEAVEPEEDTTEVSQESTSQESEETEVSSALTEPNEPEPDFDVEAELRLKPMADKAIALINADRRDLGTVSYPFEERNAKASLSATQAGLYDELENAISARVPYSFTPGFKRTYSDLIIAANALYRDKPRLSFYSKLGEIKEHSRVVGMEVRYFLPYDENTPLEGNEAALDRELARLDAVCDYIVNRMPQDFSTYDKYRYIAAVLSYIVEYDHEYEGGLSSENAYGALVSGLSICRGYAKGFEYLCERADLYCRFVQGTNMMRDVHMWNLVRLETGTYHVDVTWSDTTYGDTLGKGWMEYFMVDQKETEKNHLIDDGTVATGTRLE